MITPEFLAISAKYFLAQTPERQNLINNQYKKMGKELVAFANEHKLTPAEVIILLDSLQAKFHEYIEKEMVEFVKNLNN